jgi:GT2 family glycosyltransferase
MSVPEDVTWEIVIVDNNSTDDTKDHTARFAQSIDINVRYIFEDRQGLNNARNAGIKVAEGELLIFIDDDVEVTDNWLAEMKDAFDRYPVVGVGGKVLVKETPEKPAWWVTEYDGALGKFDAGDAIILSDDTYTSIIGIGANLGFKRSVFDKYGLFRSNLDRQKRKLLMGGDVEFVQRVKTAGELTMYYPRAVVYHCPTVNRITQSYLRRWYFRIGEWEARKSLVGKSRADTILTVPRWRYRSALGHLLKASTGHLSGHYREGFHHQLEFLSVLGYFFGALKNFLCGFPSSRLQR